MDFLASMGIGELVITARAQQQRGGRLVLFVGRNDVVCRVLDATGIPQMIPVFHELADAERAPLA